MIMRRLTLLHATQFKTDSWTLAGHFRFGRAVPQTAIAATTSSQMGIMPIPGIASIISPGNNSQCQPKMRKSAVAVSRSTAHTMGGIGVAKKQIPSDSAAMTNARSSRFFEMPSAIGKPVPALG